jgi:hypothetical protein
MRIWFAAPRAYLLLFALTLVLRIVTALPLQQAGYMDASYAIHVAENLVRGKGFTEEVLWNFLDRPAGLPHPSNLYWMPLPSLLIAPLFVLFGVSYRVAQIPFILLSSFLPLFAFYLSRKIFPRDDYAWAAAMFTAFSGFYTIYWISPDNFTSFGLTASLCLYLIARGMENMGRGQARTSAEGISSNRATLYFFAAGALAALSHLSRADGLLLLAIAPIALLAQKPLRPPRQFLLLTFYFFLVYFLLMSPWFARNYLAVGTPLPSAGTKTLWLTNYDELFRYADDLTPARYLAWGVGAILESKLFAAVRNLFIVVFGDLQLFLAPFAIIGLWRLRRRVEMLPFFVYAALLYLAMTLLFTFPSWRGSLFHSAAALLPFLAVAVPPGVDAAVQWVARRRRVWQAEIAARFFRIGFTALAVFFSLFLYAQGVFGSVIGASSDIPLWNQRDAEYPAIARWLDQNARADDIVMVVDPPTFYNVSRRRAVMIPTDNADAIFDAARQYNVRYLVLQFDHPKPLKELYKGEATVHGLKPVAEFRDALGRPVTLFEIVP